MHQISEALQWWTTQPVLSSLIGCCPDTSRHGRVLLPQWPPIVYQLNISCINLSSLYFFFGESISLVEFLSALYRWTHQSLWWKMDPHGCHEMGIWSRSLKVKSEGERDRVWGERRTVSGYCEACEAVLSVLLSWPGGGALAQGLLLLSAGELVKSSSSSRPLVASYCVFSSRVISRSSSSPNSPPIRVGSPTTITSCQSYRERGGVSAWVVLKNLFEK